MWGTLARIAAVAALLQAAVADEDRRVELASIDDLAQG